MNVRFLTCGVLVILSVVISVLYAVSKEKAANFVSGFNSLPKEKQVVYDKAYMSRDTRNRCFVWVDVMFIGAVLSYILTPYMVILAFVLWMALLFKNVHFDADKAF